MNGPKVQTYFEEDTGWPVLMSKIIIPDLRILANFMVENYKMNKDYPRTVFNAAAFVGNQGAKYLGFFSSRSLKMREKCTSFAQFVYFSREV